MKLLTLCLTVFAASAFSIDFDSMDNRFSSGSGYSHNTDDVIFAQTYSLAALTNAVRQDAICDDFILDDFSSINKVRFWIIHTGATLPIEYELSIAQDTGDSNPNNAAIIWTETVPCVVTDTGDVAFSINAPVYQIDCTYAIQQEFTPVIRYWIMIKLQDDDVFDYVLIQNPIFGNYAWTYDGTAWYRIDDPIHSLNKERDTFFEIEGYGTALQNETWGSIKSMF